MHLKRLELQGFKSFASRTELDLEAGITAVVGPNGSGKSNLAEAVRWALGEQSARQLRGSRMEDVIFHGSDHRRPVGMAEVAVTFDNVNGELALDFAEITLVRRVYRSGEGEYLVNRTSTRLKDVQELLAHTGVGRDGYAIMEQNRVDEILRARPEERRALFEEAAGITRHRQRKREALKKLEETTHSLARVADIVAELERQLEPLRREAETARAYLAHQDERQRMEEALQARDLARLSRQWSAVEERETGLRADRDGRRQALAALELELEAGRRRREDVARALAGREATLAELGARQQKAQAALLVARERHAHLAAEAGRLRGEAAAAGRKLADLEARVAERETGRAALREEVTRLAADRDRLEACRSEGEARLREQEGRLEELKVNVIDVMNRTAEARHAATRAEEDRRRLEAGLADLGRREAVLTGERQRVEELLDRARAGDQDLAARTAARREAQAAIRSRLPALAEAVRQARQQAQELKAQLAGVQARLTTLQDMETAREGLPAAARALLEEGSPGLIGLLADLVEADPEHWRALAAALDRHGGCLLVERDKLPSLVARLRQGRPGRATLWPFPLPPADVPPAPSELEVTARGPGRDVLERLLDGVRVAPGLEEALALAAASGYRYTVVTLEGEEVHPGGGVSVGAGDAASGPLGRRGEMARLERQTRELEEAGRRAGEELERLEQAVARARLEEEALRDELGRLEAEAAGLCRERENLEARLHQLAEEAAAAGLERERLGREREGAEQAARSRRDELSVLEERTRALQSETQQLEDALRRRRREAEEQSARLTQLKVELARAEQKESGAAQALEEARESLTGLAGEDEARARRLTLAEEQGRAREREAAALEAEVGRIGTELQVQEELTRTMREEREGVDRALAEQEAEARKLRGELDSLRENLHQLEVRAARLEVEYGNLARGRAPAPGASTDLGRLSEPQARARVQELDGLMAAMGTVNLGAVAECERLGERCRFLERERGDLEEARRGLDRLLGEIDQVMAERFLEGFVAIRDAFAAIFSDLFGGGRGELVLEEPDHPLETGVEIRAQPPGKRLQNLSLLSAGERALTAIALLFAILKVRPAPFCILDEIDAPLDDVNVLKFARFLKQYAAHTQFLVITHNKGTMEVADALYGVTMEEGGVSKLVSVRLAEVAATGGEAS